MSGPYELERDVPIPTASINRDPTSKAGMIRAMAVGDSIFFPEENVRVRRTWQSAAANVALQEGRTYVTRTMMKNGQRGIRVWRTA